METRMIDGSAELEQCESNEDVVKKLQKKLEDPRVKSVTVHKPGSIIHHSDGTEYIVALDGSLRKLAGKT